MRDEICKECCPYGCDAHFEEAVKDSERLEWFAKGDKTITKIEGKFFVEWEYHWEYTRSTEGHKDWRDAIDEAMKNE